MAEIKIQCPCGVYIERDQYQLLYLKKGMGEIDILCHNDFCYLKELGFVKFYFDEDGNLKFQNGRFYSPYVTWNATRMSEDQTVVVLKSHLTHIANNLIDWKKIKKSHESNALEKS